MGGPVGAHHPMRMMPAPSRRFVRASPDRRACPPAPGTAGSERRSVSITDVDPLRAVVPRPSHLRALPDARPARRPPRPWLVARPRLVRRLAGSSGASLIVLVAPAGYGKTTLLRQW